MSEALFVRDGERFVPGELTRGPWSPQAQHGGPPSALLARLVQAHEGGDDMFVARLTIELLRPVPLLPLSARVSFVRPGRKVQLVGASLFHDETEVARAQALRIRRAEVPLAAEVLATAPPPVPLGRGVSIGDPGERGGNRTYHSHAVEHRFVGGGFDRPGPATDWIRLRVPLIAGEETPALSRVAGAADFGNGISWVLNPLEGYTFINPDLTIYLQRLPRGEWVCLDAETQVGPHGVGLAQSALYDEVGLIGRSLQGLLIDRM